MTSNHAHRRERRACEVCGLVRTVTVRTYLGSADGPVVYYSRRCGACELDHRAAVLERQARVFRARAAETRAKRRARAAAKQ